MFIPRLVKPYATIQRTVVRGTTNSRARISMQLYHSKAPCRSILLTRPRPTRSAVTRLVRPPHAAPPEVGFGCQTRRWASMSSGLRNVVTGIPSPGSQAHAGRVVCVLLTTHITVCVHGIPLRYAQKYLPTIYILHQQTRMWIPTSIPCTWCLSE